MSLSLSDLNHSIFFPSLVDRPPLPLFISGDVAHTRFAFVDFSSPENQKLAVDLSERLLEGRKLLIKLGMSLLLFSSSLSPLLPTQNGKTVVCARSHHLDLLINQSIADQQETTIPQTQKLEHQNQ